MVHEFTGILRKQTKLERVRKNGNRRNAIGRREKSLEEVKIGGRRKIKNLKGRKKRRKKKREERSEETTR